MLDWLFQMQPFDLLVQGIGVIATFSCILSFQQKTQRAIVLFQLVNHALWMTHFLLLGAWGGCIMNGVGIFRCTVFAFREHHKWARHPLWYVLFCTLIMGASAFAWMQGDGAMALLPMCGMLLTTFSLTIKDPFRVRLLTFFNSPFWLTYDILNRTVPGAVTELCAMASIVIGIVRIDIPKLRAEKARKNAVQ